MNERTILDLFRNDARTDHRAHCTHFFPGGSRSFSTTDIVTACAGLAGGLARLGVTRGDRVIILSDNRPEWHVADLAVLSLGAADVPLYPTLTPAQIAYQANDSGAVAAIADSAEQMEKLVEIMPQCQALKHLIQIEGTPAPGVAALDEVIASGAGDDTVAEFWARTEQIREEDLATIVYTSGTTGAPKGAMLTHRNIVTNVRECLDLFETTPEDLALEFLPLCHVYERTGGYVYIAKGLRRAYCATANVGELLAIIRPTLFCSVPRVLEKVHAKVLAKAEHAPAVRRALFTWALSVGRKASQHRLAGTSMPTGLAVRHRLADRLVLSKVRAALGGRVRMTLSGAAPLPAHINEFFHALGIWVQEGYGLTETSPVISANGKGPGENRPGTVGRVLPNLEVRLAEDGELCVRGPSVFPGYWNKPEQTAEVFDDDGFFHTGDIARIADDGFISITDRKKDLLITAGGKNVAPQPIENRIKQSRYVDTAVLVGDRRPFIAAIISPALEELQAFANARGITTEGAAELVSHPEIVKLYGELIAEVNQELARYEQIRAFRVVARPFSIEGGELTPTMKVKRRVVEQEQAHLIGEMYGSPRAEAM